MDTPTRLTKSERDKNRKRQGQKQRKRIKILQNPTKLAFRGWEDIPDPWSLETCATYIEWCHIGKSFPEDRHNHHRRFNKANLRYCTDDAFKNRCIEVYQVLYDRATVERNEVHFGIARGVHAEVKLGKRVDWSTMVERGNKIKVPHPTNGLIPMHVRRYPEGGLGYLRTIVEAPHDNYMTEESTTDNDSDGTRTPPRPPSTRSQQRIRRRRALQMDGNDQDQNVAPAFPNEPVIEATNGPIRQATEEEVAVPMQEEIVVEVDTVESLKKELNDKIIELQGLYEDSHNFRVQLEEKDNIISRQSQEISRLQRALEATTITNEVPSTIVEPQGIPAADIAAEGEDLPSIRAQNVVLQERLDALVSQYYQWKLACVFTVDRSRQMATEFTKIFNTYLEHNQERVFGLTSWQSVDDLFQPDKMVTKVITGNQTVIDWARSGWDFQNAMSAHVHVPRKLLWPKPSAFVEDGTQCIICLNNFGPEGGMHLGTCGHLYHPICLISLMVNRRRCAVCKAPFHERLYELFGLIEFMPPSWEFDASNAPDHSSRWGEDLIWNWRYKYHSLEKSQLCDQWGWETDPEAVVRVCHNLIRGTSEVSQGKRNFFYQCFNGHWDENEKKFRFGPHPNNWIWDKEGVRLYENEVTHVESDNDDGYEMPGPRERVMMSESEWRNQFKLDAVDFLMDQHSPQTREALQQLQQSQVLRAILEEDGPARRTRSAVRRLRLGSDEDNIPQSGTHDSEAGPSGTSSGPMEVD